MSTENAQITVESAREFLEDLTPAGVENFIRWATGLPDWRAGLTPRELAKQLLKKLAREDGGELVWLFAGGWMELDFDRSHSNSKAASFTRELLHQMQRRIPPKRLLRILDPQPCLVRPTRR